MNAKRICTILALFIFLSVPTMGFTQKNLVISQVEDAGPIDKIAEHVLKEAYLKLNITITIRKTPPERALSEANGGVVDGDSIRIAGVEQNYPNLIMVPVSIGGIDWIAFTKQVRFPVQGWESLKPYSIAFQRGLKAPEKRTQGMNRIMMSTTEKLFIVLGGERIDVAIAVREDGLTALKKLGLSDITPLEPPLERTPLYHYLHKRHAQLVPKLTAVLQEMEQQGRIKAIHEKFLSDFMK